MFFSLDSILGLEATPLPLPMKSHWPRMVYLERKGHKVRRSVDSSSRWWILFWIFDEALGVYMEWEFRLHRSYIEVMAFVSQKFCVGHVGHKVLTTKT